MCGRTSINSLNCVCAWHLVLTVCIWGNVLQVVGPLWPCIPGKVWVRLLSCVSILILSNWMQFLCQWHLQLMTYANIICILCSAQSTSSVMCCNSEELKGIQYRSGDPLNGVFSVQLTESNNWCNENTQHNVLCVVRTAKEVKTVDITILYYNSVHSNTVDCTHASPYQATNLTNLPADTCSCTCVQRTDTAKYSDNTTTVIM